MLTTLISTIYASEAIENNITVNNIDNKDIINILICL